MLVGMGSGLNVCSMGEVGQRKVSYLAASLLRSSTDSIKEWTDLLLPYFTKASLDNSVDNLH